MIVQQKDYSLKLILPNLIKANKLQQNTKILESGDGDMTAKIFKDTRNIQLNSGLNNPKITKFK